MGKELGKEMETRKWVETEMGRDIGREMMR